ncbi:toll/interleukin-1 receptor domain-containing protein [Rhodococcus sp. IEGM 1241]|uniref:toll/interleukin-1 receptor domain-containing protein n=1 Tax=Rhodococcus sp. IEGM 1241 TaxID=3082228 RepID=UPI0029545584|nr:toll/interleukin-1 receptor domain-containing protein [Rhodococcus sp. IEGM 1241]MDV8015993.1 toll/interleukin-1 receptor domain-containing protein [Rhodococcus sp. IEGM 1241]
MTSTEAKHAFISYVNEDTQQVDGLCKVLEAAQIPYWRDRTALTPGDNWKAKIREAIRSGALVFIACFSDNSRSKHKSVMNEELTLAVEEFRQMAPGLTWLISVRLDDGPIPEWDLGAGRALGDLQYVSLFGDQYATEAVKLVTAVSLAMGTNGPDPATTRAAVEEAADRDRPALLRQLTKDMVLNPARRIELDELIAQETKTILTAMRDEERFPTQNIMGANDNERIAHLATVATNYWKLIEPFCWSLQVAARWAPDAAALAPWTNALRAICAQSTEIKSGIEALLALRSLPAMVATFTAGLTCVGQPSWDNFKTLLVDTIITDRNTGQRTPLIEATYPWLPFRNADLVPHVLARSAIKDEDPATALAAFTEGKVGKFHTPVAEWLHHVLRPMFDEQFPDNATYTNDFELAEVMMGIISQNQALQLAGDDPHRQAWAHSSWFGRSAWRSRRGYATNPLVEIAQQKLADGAAWPPLKSGLFGGDSERADKAISAYAEDFGKAGNQHL